MPSPDGSIRKQMARKKVLEGGKREEIIAAAEKLFFSKGYENTSVRMVLDEVGGEVGMFYHYFRSKEELFDVAVERFFSQYASGFEQMLQGVDDIEDLVDGFLPGYEKAMEQFSLVRDRLHWTVASAFHEKTVLSLVPGIAELLEKKSCDLNYPVDIAAAKIVADISAAIHSQSFAAMDDAEKKDILIRLIKETISDE